jgi:hypothetical protein
MKFLLLVLALVGCQKVSHKEQQTKPVEKSKLEQVLEKAAVYKKLQAESLDSYGWPVGCDGLGFLALCKTAGGCEKADFFAGEEQPGKWQRNHDHNCVETGKSKTSISKDMIMMSFVYALFGMSKDEATGYLDRLETYGKANDWVMGYPSETIGDLGRVYMTPTMVVTLYNLIEKITGKKEEISELKAAVPEGYQAHLRALDILIQGKMNGGLDTFQMADITELHDRDPKNALYQAAFHRFKDGEMGEVVDILLDEKLFPKDRLPASSDRCESYIWQRVQSKDWEPCAESKSHDGIDYLFAVWVAGLK